MSDWHRILILGNTGSGKSWLADQLARRFKAPIIELDRLHWLPGGYNQRRAPDEAKADVCKAAALDAWIIEGVFGWLAREALPRTALLVWLVIPEDECVRNLKGRAIKSGEDEASRTALFQWCLEYRTRENANSYAGHLAIYEEFCGGKQLFRSRAEIENFLSDFT